MADNLSDMIAIVDAISDKTTAELCALFPTALQGVSNDIEREQIHYIFLARAEQINDDAKKAVEGIYRKYSKARKSKATHDALVERAAQVEDYRVQLETNKMGIL